MVLASVAVDFSELWRDPDLRRNLIATVVVLVAALIVRLGARRWIRRAPSASEQSRLRWLSTARNVTLGFALFAVGLIWAAELQTFALSVVAIAAAIVLATKELIMCLSGTLLRAGSGAFAVGDRVEMGGVRGDVIDSTLLATMLLEVGPGHMRTGRSVVVPNSAMLSGSVINETFMDKYVVHVITVPVDPKTSWEAAEAALLEAATEACDEYVEPARRFMDALSARHSLPKLSVDPRVLVSIPKPDEVALVLRVPAPVRERGKVEQRILRGYLQRRAGDPPPVNAD